MSPAPKKIPLASSLKGSPSALRMASTGANAAAAAVVAAAIANRATATTTTTNNNNNIDAAPRRTNALPNSNYSSMLFLSNNDPDLAATMALVAFLRAEADAADQKAKSFRRQAQQLAVQFGIHDNVQQRYEIDPQQLPPLDEHGVPKYRGLKRGRKPKPKVRKAKNPNRPKRRHTGYTLFMHDQYPKIKALHPKGYPSKDIISAVANAWKSFSPLTKAEWKQKAKDDAAAHDLQLEQQQQQQQQEQQEQGAGMASTAAAVASKKASNHASEDDEEDEEEEQEEEEEGDAIEEEEDDDDDDEEELDDDESEMNTSPSDDEEEEERDEDDADSDEEVAVERIK